MSGEERVERTGLNRQGCHAGSGPTKLGRVIKLVRTPGLRGESSQIGEPPGISGRIERLIGQNPARLVLPMPVATCTGKDRYNHLGTVSADH